jgi:uncharacterized protein YecT (DUF1311 family)
MLWRFALVISVTCCAVPLPASAQQSSEFQACITESEGGTDRMLGCGKVEIDKWDARLNAAYSTLLHDSKGEDRAHLQSEQRAWLKHHLSETHRLAVNPINGSAAFIDSQAFELHDLSERTLTLEKRVRMAR